VQEDSLVRAAAYLSNRTAVGQAVPANSELTESQRALEAVLQRLEFQSQRTLGEPRVTENWITESPVPSSNGQPASEPVAPIN
jgi:hypothetical protein